MTFFHKAMSLSLAAGMAVALFAATTASAATADDVTVVANSSGETQLTKVVRYSDLNLASSSGVKSLTRRVNAAVRAVCAPLDERARLREHGACRSFAWNGARPQMDQAIARAQQLAATGTTSIAPTAIVISARAD